MANVIIGIHGLDNKPPKEILEKWWKEAIIEGLQKCNYPTELPHFEMVYWADILHIIPQNESETDMNSPFFLDEKYAKAADDFVPENHDTRIKIVDYLSHKLNKFLLNDDYTSNYEFVTDTIVDRYFDDLSAYYHKDPSFKIPLSNKTKMMIRQRLESVLKKYKNDKIMLISHSMGTIIAYDVLSFVTPEINIDTFITIGSPLALPIVLSQIAAERKLTQINGFVKITAPENINKWVNYSDILDKIAFNYKLNDDFAPNTKGVSPTDFLVTNNYQINGVANPHKSYGYLRTPEIANVINQFILSEEKPVRPNLIARVISNIKELFCKEKEQE